MFTPRNFSRQTLAALVGLALLLSPAAGGQSSASSSQSNTAPKPATLAATLASQVSASPFVRRTMANGLEIVVFEDHTVPLVTLDFVVRAGAQIELPQQSGMSHMVEHLFFTTNRAVENKEPYLQEIGQHGIAYNGETAEEYSQDYLTSTSGSWRIALRFLRDAAVYPVLEPVKFENERKVVLAEMDRAQSPYLELNDEMARRLYGSFAQRRHPIGTRDVVGGATEAQVKDFEDTYFVPNNSAIVVAGDVKPDEAFRAVEEAFKDWKRAPDPFVAHPIPPVPPLAAPYAAVLEEPVQTAILEMGWQGPSVGEDPAATYAADVFSYILRQDNSKFHRALVDTGLVTVVDLGYFTQRNHGPITLVAQAKPEQAKAAAAAIRAQLLQFGSPGYFSDEELENAKAALAASDLRSRERPSEYARTLAFWWSVAGTGYTETYQAKLQQVSRADVEHYLQNYILSKPAVTLVMLSHEAEQATHLSPHDLETSAGSAP